MRHRARRRHAGPLLSGVKSRSLADHRQQKTLFVLLNAQINKFPKAAVEERGTGGV
ncbi:hypothetical protein PCAR4_250040 [Paraburkholderia caribensis]|nr:hypothetical protein PCAR4_250040 [Paraburkholderia caribensis]